MKSLLLLASMVVVALPHSATAEAGDDPWAGYLDYAYVFSSADAGALRARLGEYGRESGINLEAYVAKQFGAGALDEDVADAGAIRRAAIAHLLLYLSTGEPDSLDASVDAARRLEDELSRHENRYWYHYILAHQALESGQRFDFVGELLDLWLHVVTPLEGPYETLQTLSLSDAPHSGFVSALPYVYENVSRLILIRSQEMGVDRDLDPLGAIVRMLLDRRVGHQPDVIPVELTSRDYLERIVSRLDGPESDVGSLTFTLALFEASKYHDLARALLATEGLADETVEAMRVASGAYEKALNRAETLQGQGAVYTRVLRQLGEVYAAKQRLGVDPDIETSFSIEGAIDVYANLQRDGLRKGSAELGYTNDEQYLEALHALWEEIQEASLNAADYYLTRAVEQRHLADEHGRSAARIHARYLGFFHKFATSEARQTVPDSAYFAAYEAARGYGDALLSFTPGHLSGKELELATRRYVAALKLFPFDLQLWNRLTLALERQGRESRYLDLARPVAERVTRSRHVDGWIARGDPGAERIEALRRAFADTQAVVYLGFGDGSNVPEIHASIALLEQQRDEVEARLVTLTDMRDGHGRMDTAPASSGGDDLAVLELAQLSREIGDAKALLVRFEKQIVARRRALPLYREALAADGLADEMRAQRDHPAHTLLRRMYHENRS